MCAFSSNSREFHRINFECKVSLNFMESNHSNCQTENLSLTGMFVAGDFQVKKDEQCQVYFFYSHKSEKSIFRTTAKVVWCNKRGVALHFTSMPIESYMSLVKLLVYSTELPEVILYEISKICPFEVARA